MHYVCKGECGGLSETPKVCETEGCSRYNDALEECDCSNPENHKYIHPEDE